MINPIEAKLGNYLPHSMIIIATKIKTHEDTIDKWLVQVQVSPSCCVVFTDKKLYSTLSLSNYMCRFLNGYGQTITKTNKILWLTFQSTSIPSSRTVARLFI